VASGGGVGSDGGPGIDENGMDELALFRETLRGALGTLSPSAEVRRLMATESGWEQHTWQRLCSELGLAGLAVPEAYGGSGFSALELGVAFEEAGRTLLCAPLLSVAALAAPLLLALDDEKACKTYLPGLCDGSLTATVVTADTAGRSLPGGEPVRAEPAGGKSLLTGTADFVVDGATADLIMVPAATATGLGVYAVRPDTPGLVITPLVTLDPTRKQARLRFDDVPGTPVGPADAARAVREAFDVANALLAAEQAGVAARCLELAVAHARTRVQFGLPIGSFQAVKQKAADMLIRVESARSAAMAATEAAARVTGAGKLLATLTDLPDLAVTAAAARAYCGAACVAVAADTIQLHGGLGFTWEHDAHLYFKRAWTSAEMLGGTNEHIETVARYLAGL
jgi:acyl-CoA dehydrogenase